MSHTISIAQAQEILYDFYNIKGTATALPGELDLNFKIKVDGKNTYILKIAKANTDEGELDFQTAILDYLLQENTVQAPTSILTKEGKKIGVLTTNEGNRHLRLITWFEGRLWSDTNPHTEELRLQLGIKAGEITAALKNFDHPFAHRALAWDTAQSLWTKEKLHLFSGEQKQLVSQCISAFEHVQSTYTKLPKQVVHNDANDNNILVNHDLLNPEVIAIIDYGDAVFTQRVNDLGIACAYASMNIEEPLRAILPIVKGYNQLCPLTEDELAHLYHTIVMRLVTTVTKAAMNRIAEPENEYHFISEAPAWACLEKWCNIDPEFALVRFRESVGLTPHPHREGFSTWVSQQKIRFSDLFPTVHKDDVHPLDLSVGSTWVAHQEDFNNLDYFQYQIDQLQKEVPDKVIAGGYLEPRALYTDSSFDTDGNYGKQSRSVHLGVDFWLPAQTPVHAILDGEVVVSTYQEQHKNYGGLIILKHEGTVPFYTLYGHLSKASALAKKVGEIVKKNEKIAVLGAPLDNGDWAPHLHFQVMLSLLNYKNDFPGVAFHHQIGSWASLCPDPMQLFGLDTLSRKRVHKPSAPEVKAFRHEHLGRGMSLQYQKPLHILRGNGAYLIDADGRKYLDTVNNVAHVGHEHYAVVKAGRSQMSVLNTNSRYLHPAIKDFGEALLETLPPELSVLHFVNSGSEANELAIRMARAVTGSREIIASEVGYHGNTNMTVDISSYKFDGKGGSGAPDFTHIFPLPDAYRGKHTGDDAAQKYATEVQKCIDTIHENGKKVSALIIESIISCGGQIPLPEGFLKAAFKNVRAAGGICISDEVQTGVGRVGKTFWGFELHDVVPDIVTIGKPIGNGHPLAVVACTREVADAFANGMEFFNTFGGNPVSCAIGNAVLDVVKGENLQSQALEVGNFLKSKLLKLKEKFPIIGDVRGEGLFLGFELVDIHKNPLPDQTDYLINRMKDHSILMSSDGPDHNVIKIKPPMVFSKTQAELLVTTLDKIFTEDYMKLQE